MHASQVSDNHCMQELERVAPLAQNVPNLFQLFSVDLRQCPRFDRTAEYALACQTRTAWRHLVHSLEMQHDYLARLLGPHLMPSSYDTISESDIVLLLHHVQVHMDRTKVPQSSPGMVHMRDWLAQMQTDLANFRYCRDEMVRRNLRFVVMLARRYSQSQVDLLDLVQEGTLGLMRAVEKFDPDRGISFASYAVWWIREAFARAMISKDVTLCFSEATPREEEEVSIIDLIAAPEETAPDVNVLNADITTKLYQALTSLPAWEAVILRLHFGLNESHTYTLAEISQRLGLTRTQVRLREQRALVRLRAYLQRPTKATLQHRQEPQRRWRKAAGKRTR